MLHSPHRSELGSDFALIFKAVVDAFRGLSTSSRLEGRSTRLRQGGCC